MNYYSPIMDFNNYTIESKGVSNIGIQVSRDEEDYLEEEMELDRRRVALERVIEENNKKISKFERQMGDYI